MDRLALLSMKCATLVGSLAFASAMVCVRPARACQTTTCSGGTIAGCVRDPLSLCWNGGAPVSWWRACTSFSVQAAGVPRLGLDYAATEAIVSRAFEQWTSAICSDGSSPSIALAPIGPLECSSLEYNPEGPNANAVLFRDGGWAHESNALALTTVTYRASTGEILDAEMELNLDNPSLALASLPYVVTHEAGHFLGLDHSPDTEALMYAQYTPVGRDGTPLLPDDVAAICSAYPARNAGECEFAPTFGFDARCGGDLGGGCTFAPPRAPVGPTAWLCLAALVGLAARSQRQLPSLGRRRMRSPTKIHERLGG